MDKVVIVIPARFASTRLPGKPLVDILGKPMIQHVHERALEVPGIASVIIATDDDRIEKAAHEFGAHCLMTSPEHTSGTDRLIEIMDKIDADLYVNLQGDEPLIRPSDISLLVNGMLEDPEVQVGTLCHDLPPSEAHNPNQVKVTLSYNGNALYFSRSPIPYPRDPLKARYLKHIGIYAYRRHALQTYRSLTHSMLEEAEGLEQLRLMSAGLPIRAFKVAPTGPGVDTPTCLLRVRALMSGVDYTASPIPSLDETRLVITDVDGVLTDGSIIYDDTGECVKSFHVRDGLGIRMLEESGIRVAVLSGRDSPALRKRVSDLGIQLCNFGVKDKANGCKDLMQQAGVSAHHTVYIGDDSIDIPAFTVCGLSYAVADSPEYVKSKATHVLENAGGKGAFRELSDAILRARGQSEIFETAEGFRKIMAGVRQ